MWLDEIKAGIAELKELISKQKEKKAETFEAVEAIFAAANQTTLFLQACMRKVEKPNAELSELWLQTASKVRGLDNNIYERVLAKSEYWADPGAWDDDKIARANIALESIKVDAKEILKDK